jgi:dTDP-4-dehydrorhamnose reductase
MKKIKVLVLGHSGMIANALFQSQHFGSFNTTFTTTSSIQSERVIPFDALKDSLEELIQQLKPNKVINAVGLIHQRFGEFDDWKSRARILNSDLPIQLSILSEKYRFDSILLGTNCVYSGTRGGYNENDAKDISPDDLYGITKKEGEITNPYTSLLRFSCIGVEPNPSYSLLGWMLSQGRGAKISGFSNHPWNGITTIALARVLAGIIRSDFPLSGFQHLIPSEIITKFEVLKLAAKQLGRSDIEIEDVTSDESINRTLGTVQPAKNSEIWKLAGYSDVPSIGDLIGEMGAR